MKAAAILSRWKEESVTPSTSSVLLCESTSSTFQYIMSNESTDLANPVSYTHLRAHETLRHL
eukprot:5833043-Ditylum_brightwellii.AAC.1